MILWKELKPLLVRTSYNKFLYINKNVKGTKYEPSSPLVTEEQSKALDILLERGFDGWYITNTSYNRKYADSAFIIVYSDKEFSFKLMPMGQILLEKITIINHNFESYKDLENKFNKLNWPRV